jgi:hypothetical protein
MLPLGGIRLKLRITTKRFSKKKKKKKWKKKNLGDTDEQA